MTIDWDAPLETDEDEPRPALVIQSQSSVNEFRASVMVGRVLFEYVVKEDGVINRYGVPPLRNVRPRAANQDAWVRMEILVRTMAKKNYDCDCRGMSIRWVEDYKEAAAIAEKLPPERVPVDPDISAARAIMAKHYPGAQYETGTEKELAAALECIRHGRDQ